MLWKVPESVYLLFLCISYESPGKRKTQDFLQRNWSSLPSLSMGISVHPALVCIRFGSEEAWEHLPYFQGQESIAHTCFLELSI